MSYSLNSSTGVKGLIWVITIAVMKGDTESLDCGSY